MCRHLKAVFYACKRQKINLKKTSFYQERDEAKRAAF
ncbi:IS630 transposase-related protein [Candidatus Protochlamydia amoebophila]